MKYIEPITDRTITDVTNKTAKAYFNIADWIRVYNNAEMTNYLIGWLLEQSITFDTVAVPTISTIPTAASLNTLLENIERIRVTAGLPIITGLTELKTDWASGSSAESPDYLDANTWELVMDLLIKNVVKTVEYAVYCGVSQVGQIRYYQNRFRQFTRYVEPAASPVRNARCGVALSGSGLTRQNEWRKY